MLDRFVTFITGYINILKWNDVFDIIILAIVIYWTVRLVSETRAEQLIKGIFFLWIFTGISGWLKLNGINFVLTNTMQVGVLAIIIMFQPELRRALEKVGRTRFGNIFTTDTYVNQDVDSIIIEISKAVEQLSKNKMGALIAIERRTKLGDVISTGAIIDAVINAELICNIFYPKAPLHDGAIVIRDNVIKAAACLLPLTQNQDLSSELGTRHRAAIGITENSDCVTIVVSEETGKVSLARSGHLTRNLTFETLKKALDKILKTQNSSDTIKSRFWKGRPKKQ